MADFPLHISLSNFATFRQHIQLDSRGLSEISGVDAFGSVLRNYHSFMMLP